MKLTLKDVAEKAMSDPIFWKKLRANAEQALEANRIELAPTDSKRLKAILGLDGKTLKLDLGRLMALARRRNQSAANIFESLTWMGLWNTPVAPQVRRRAASKTPR